MASMKFGIHERRVADSRAPGLAGFRSLRLAGFGAFHAAGLRVEWTLGVEEACSYGLPTAGNKRRKF